MIQVGHARAAAERAAVAPNDEHDVVDAFLSEIEPACDAVDEPQQRVIVGVIELAQRVAVAVGNTLEQREIRAVVGEARPSGANVQPLIHRLIAMSRRALVYAGP